LVTRRKNRSKGNFRRPASGRILPINLQFKYRPFAGIRGYFSNAEMNLVGYHQHECCLRNESRGALAFFDIAFEVICIGLHHETSNQIINELSELDRLVNVTHSKLTATLEWK
jgi:hypothetical protein